jgi:upstream activation factor subunit UAF30
MASLESVQDYLISLEKSVKALQKEVHRIRQKIEDPDGEKAKARSENNSFKHPQKISEDLRAFLGLAQGEMISRSDVTKRIFAYAKEKGLNSGKIIKTDDALHALLTPEQGVDITVTNLQRYINHHYVGKAPKAEPESQSQPEPPTPRKGKPKVAKA